VIRLVGVELTRLRWRRAVLVLLLVAIVVPALIAAVRVWNTRPISDDDIAFAEKQGATEIAQCIRHPQRYGVGRANAEVGCHDLVVGWYTGRTPLSLAGERQGGSGVGVVAILTAVLLLAGTTFVGHDWASGSMSNQLLFQARRGRVWTAKALAVTLVSFVVAALVSTAYWVTIWAVVQARDLPMRDGALWDSLAFGLRGAAFATAAALGGYALTMLFRSTVATVGVLFGVAVAGGIVIAALGVGEQWQPQKMVAAVVKNGTTYYVDVPESCFGPQQQGPPAPNSECDSERDLSLWSGVGYYGSALVVTVGASVLSFRRRDVP
jgi:hypothetical protein